MTLQGTRARVLAIGAKRAVLLLACTLMLCATGCVVGTIGDEGEDGEDVGEEVLPLEPAPQGGYSLGQDKHEHRKSVPITKGSAWRVVYSLPLQGLSPGERVAVRGEVQLTVCHASDLGKSPCRRVTPFDPKFKAKIVLGQSHGDAKGKTISKVVDMTCTAFKHHCAVAIPEHITGGWSGFKYANLVVAAHGTNPSSKDVMIVNKDHGGLAVTRLGKGASAQGSSFKGHQAAGGWMKLDMENKHPRKPHVTLQAVLHGAKPGDIIDVDARIEARTHGGGSKPSGCQGARDPLIAHQVVVSKHKDALGSKLTSVTAKNGRNCKLGQTCSYRKSGAVRLPKDTPATVYVSVVSWGGRSCSASGDAWTLGNASALHAGRRR